MVKYASSEVLAWWHYSTKPIIADKLLSLWGFSLCQVRLLLYIAEWHFIFLI